MVRFSIDPRTIRSETATHCIATKALPDFLQHTRRQLWIKIFVPQFRNPVLAEVDVPKRLDTVSLQDSGGAMKRTAVQGQDGPA